jgi:hypothetical protein
MENASHSMMAMGIPNCLMRTTQHSSPSNSATSSATVWMLINIASARDALIQIKSLNF